jgi:hypothetical protein
MVDQCLGIWLCNYFFNPQKKVSQNLSFRVTTQPA